jgi:dihydrofolate reductase
MEDCERSFLVKWTLTRVAGMTPGQYFLQEDGDHRGKDKRPSRVIGRGEVTVRRVRYSVATSLDGYIAGPKGEYDWIIMDPDIDFRELFAQFDTLLMGRVTYEAAASMGPSLWSGMKVVVFSKTLSARDHPGVTIVADKTQETVADLRAQPGKDIWLFGGGQLFRSMAEAGLVDTVELSVIPVLLGGGIPFYPAPASQRKLTLTGHKVYSTGIVAVQYALTPGTW